MALTKNISTLNRIIVIILALGYLAPVLTNTVENSQPQEQTSADTFDSEMLKEDLSDKEITLENHSLFWQSAFRQLTLDYFLSQAPKEPEIKLNTPPPQA